MGDMLLETCKFHGVTMEQVWDRAQEAWKSALRNDRIDEIYVLLNQQNGDQEALHAELRRLQEEEAEFLSSSYEKQEIEDQKVLDGLMSRLEGLGLGSSSAKSKD